MLRLNTIRRKDAITTGLNKYFTGRPCKRGHTSERYVDSGVCIQCLRANVDRYRAENTDAVNQRVKAWRVNNPTYYKDHYAVNPTESQQRTKEWKRRNPDRVALMMDRRGDKLKRATPGWFETDRVRQLYQKRDELSKTWGIELTVDHIIPIQSDTVCGLHCWANLQLITREDNGRKHIQYQTDW